MNDETKKDEIENAIEGEAVDQSETGVEIDPNDELQKVLFEELEMKPVALVEDIPDDMPVTANEVLTDEQLARSGVVKVSAYMRTEKSKQALRSEKHKKKAAEGSGDKAPRKQLNVVAPTDEKSREALKNVAAAMVEGELSDHLVEVLASNKDFDEAVRVGVKAIEIMEKGGFRAAMIKRWLK